MSAKSATPADRYVPPTLLALRIAFHSRNVLPFCSRQAARDWVYARDGRASITNHSLGNMITEMRIVNQAHQAKRVLTMGGALCSWSSVVLHPCSPPFPLFSYACAEMDTIIKGLSVSKAVYDAEETRLAKVNISLPIDYSLTRLLTVRVWTTNRWPRSRRKTRRTRGATRPR